MSRNFNLTFTTIRGDFVVPVTLEKSFSERQSLKTGYKGKPLRWIKVEPKPDAPAQLTSRKHISHICKAEEIESLYPTGDVDSDGEEKFVVVDKQSLKKAFPTRKEMRVLRTVPASQVPIHFTTGQHYMLNVHQKKVGKKKVTNREDQAMYSLVHSGLTEKNEVLVVKYTANNNNKFAVVYSTPDGLRMSVMIASDYQKERSQSQTVGDCRIKLYDRLVGGTRRDELGTDDFKDDYGDRLNEVIRAALNGEEYTREVEPECESFSRLAALESSDDDSDDDEKMVSPKGSRKGSRSKRSVSKSSKNTVKNAVKKKARVVGVDSDTDSSDSE